jgi:hypothetical protein
VCDVRTTTRKQKKSFMWRFSTHSTRILMSSCFRQFPHVLFDAWKVKDAVRSYSLRTIPYLWSAHGDLDSSWFCCTMHTPYYCTLYHHVCLALTRTETLHVGISRYARAPKLRLSRKLTPGVLHHQHEVSHSQNIFRMIVGLFCARQRHVL